jgi:hypothetical protein
MTCTNVPNLALKRNLQKRVSFITKSRYYNGYRELDFKNISLQFYAFLTHTCCSAIIVTNWFPLCHLPGKDSKGIGTMLYMIFLGNNFIIIAFFNGYSSIMSISSKCMGDVLLWATLSIFFDKHIESRFSSKYMIQNDKIQSRCMLKIISFPPLSICSGYFIHPSRVQEDIITNMCQESRFYSYYKLKFR